MSSEVTPSIAPAGPPGDAPDPADDKEKYQRVMYSACPNLGAFRWLFMSNDKARVGTGRYAPRALGIVSGVMLLAAVPTGLLALLLRPLLSNYLPMLANHNPVVFKGAAHNG